MTLNIAIVGKNGQLARALQKHAAILGYHTTCIDRSDCDLESSADLIQSYIEELTNIDAVIIAAAYTAVDKAEVEPEIAYAVNTTAPEAIAKACAKMNLPLVHVSTDYVFPGTNRHPASPTDATDPINMYGLTKLEGEKAVFRAWSKTAIFRTSWVFDGTGHNFLTTMLSLAKTKKELRIVHDQIGRPTYAGHLAAAILNATQKLCSDALEYSGIFHISGTGSAISWAEFAQSIFSLNTSSLDHQVVVIPISSSEYPTPAKRPQSSLLNVSSFETTFNYTLPDWQEGLAAACAEWYYNLEQERVSNV